MNRSADWLNQAQAVLELAGVSAAAGHHEWACFACHQAVEKALKGLHLRHGQQAWGYGLGRSWRDLPPAVSSALAASVSDLEDRLRILDACISRRAIPIACPTLPRPTISAGSKARTPFAMPVRSLTQSLLRWPEPEHVLNQVRLWAAQAAAAHPGLERVCLFGSYGRGDAGVGSDLNLLLIDSGCSGPQHQRLLARPAPGGAAAELRCPGAHPHGTRRTAGQRLSHGHRPAA